ncbi:tRNA (5-methylaminomethyl-2-thiouridine)(34)-methyltransferase MnmD [Filimonas effusa]|uniref:MnmC-like methyltransferase domain-containing protein n=1 Tax=Filimonas effusa TaxID=2508721 RepID=A0A4Q1D544_9BACT|nr:tRNA (5-methylaminomethyl-2-thiouridine)(34)-methyltransferase MnmD [Filimonas effusa]RXK83559.1 hypothetical protein ESB13_15835 [Filimonas effusa]
MKRSKQITRDGSHTISIPSLDVTFHSVYGAIQESMWVFIISGWKYWLQQPQVAEAPEQAVRILEMGFGTGLNALLTLQQARLTEQPVFYQSVEQYPLTAEEADGLNYADQLNDASLAPYLEQLHSSAWNEDLSLTPYFTLHKSHAALQDLQTDHRFHIIYYDAFAPRAQPELWTEEIFSQLIGYLEPSGILLTYCSKSIVRKAMQAAGFTVEKIQGPPHKREMLRAHKPISLV